MVDDQVSIAVSGWILDLKFMGAAVENNRKTGIFSALLQETT